MHAGIPYLREVLIFLAAAGLIVPLVRRLRISPVLGFLCIGLLIGPYGLGRLTSLIPSLELVVITETEGIEAIGELGVIFLLFSIGLEMSFRQIWNMRRDVFGLGSAQIVVSAVAIGGTAYWLGVDIPAAILLGLCLALSSTAIVMQLLSEQLRLSSTAGRATFSILLMQDLAVVPILFLVGIFASQGGTGAVAGLIALVEAIAVIGAIFLAGRFLVRPLLRYAGGSGSQELFMACVLLLIIGTSAVTAVAGLSMALGAFLAGLLFAATEYRHQIHNDIEPFKGLLLGLFFISVGMQLDVTAVWDQAEYVLLAALGLIALKAAILFLLARIFRHSTAIAAEISILLGEGGEFALVAVAAGTAAGVISVGVAQFVVLVVVVTMFTAPLLAALGRRVGQKLSAAHAMDIAGPDAENADRRVVIGGFGRVGRAIGKILEDQRIPYLAIDSDADLVARERNAGLPIHYGDASNDRFLREIGIDTAIAFISTMDRRAGAEAVVSALHKAHPHLPIYARAKDPAHARALKNCGAEMAIPETTEAGLQLSEAVLIATGIPDETANAIIEQERSNI
ncbi:CPA2 family monovalent cation:H+ antiporter-2 [Altererythrobacter atlanticus]|uniref:Glutathione-regulated potassium-efflux system protein KefC n=1 Tax=Croceibacterium atlanticum TaxID=1267766 RepID=A0A0F7KQ38_9SPHN|nr:monovalent cation:proton antiporter-2 (CPA2) family protein [Croceibacterium atlanticum]AKH41246.1 Glutathione-regulated potassium-efflux system protein KefC [Croceibacterium atlanticum]MBB5732764.1 CPA2 family monovalent cation:H+ antiporter-2 [Croceibacterium atlanticum]